MGSGGVLKRVSAEEEMDMAVQKVCQQAVQTDLSVFLEQNLLLRRQVVDLQDEVKALQQAAADAQVEVKLQKSQCTRVSKQLRRLKEERGASD